MFKPGASGDSGGISPLDLLVPGMILPFAGNAAPAGWLLCNGQTVSQITYAVLFALIGTTYNVGGEPGGTFRLPNLAGRSAIGVGTAQTKNWTLAERYGDEDLQQHNHAVTDIGHNHTQLPHSHPLSDPGHNHTQNAHTHVQNAHNHTYNRPYLGAYSGSDPVANTANWYTYTSHTPNTADTTATNQNTTATNNASSTGASVDSNTANNVANTTGVTVNNQGSGNTQNISPGLGLTYVIKY